MRHLWLVGTVLSAPACDRFEPEPVAPSRFAFEQGAHESVTCESCHADDPATPTIVTCAGTAPAWNGVGCRTPAVGGRDLWRRRWLSRGGGP